MRLGTEYVPHHGRPWPGPHSGRPSYEWVTIWLAVPTLHRLGTVERPTLRGSGVGDAGARERVGRGSLGKRRKVL